MALEHNIDVRIEQVDQVVADVSIARTNGGGLPRAINYGVSETPAGKAVAAQPLLASASSTLSPTGVNPSGVTVSSSYDVGGVLEAQHSLLIVSEAYSVGARIPAFDLAFQGQFAWFRRDASIPSELPSTTPGSYNNTTNNTLGNVNLLKGLSSGATLQVGINDFTQTFYSANSTAIPFTHPNVSALIAQPLLRGAGRSNNTRFIAIAKTNKKISAAILEQQMISTVSGVEALYYDLVSLQDSVTVQEEALKAAKRLLSDNRQQLVVGHMAPIEVTRAQALVTASQLALAQTNALRQQQVNILRSVLDPDSLTNLDAKLTDIVATDELSVPLEDALPTVQVLIEHAWAQRPDVRQSTMQLTNGERAVAGSGNARLPQLDVYGEYQTRGSIITGLVPLGGDSVYGAGTLVPVPAGGTRSAQVYEVGLQFNLPVQNRIAQADYKADRALLQQARLRVTQIKAQAAAEIRNALIALSAAREAVLAASTSRKLQEQLLSAENDKFIAGMSTNFAVIEQQTYLAQAQTTEVASKAAWKKASVQLTRALGDTLEQHNIEMNPKAGNPTAPPK